MRHLGLLVFASLLAALAGCNGGTSTPADGGGSDTGAADSGASDTGAADTGASDTGATDTGGGDTGMSDAGGQPDTGPGTDTGVPCGPATDCGIGLYCHTPDGMCSGTGSCERADPGATCPGVYAPVCGCDGVTYNNPCDAARNGTAVDTSAVCAGTTPCHLDSECAGGEFCNRPDGVCGGVGNCASRGIGRFCSDVCEPECGCDGNSYVNDCQRRQAGVSLASLGNCPGGTPACAAGGGCCATTGDCGMMQECVGGHPGAMTGRCEPIPAPPECWTDFDCDATRGLHCMGFFVCPCGSTCPRPDTTGTCM